MNESQNEKGAGSSENSDATSLSLRLLSLINKPLAITVFGGVIVFLVTSYMQQQYWIAQQRYLFQQESMKFRLSTIDETVKSVDKLLSAYGAEFTAYESDFDGDQIRETDNRFQSAVDEWEKEFDLRKLRVSLYFPDPKVKKAWDKLDSDLGTLDCYVMRLGTSKVPNQFGCEELKLTKLSQSDLIAKGRPNVEQAEEDLQKLAKLMVDYSRESQ